MEINVSFAQLKYFFTTGNFIQSINFRNQLVNEELKIIPVRGLPIETTWSLIWPISKQHSPVSQPRFFR
jgi:hypothetical protein